MASFFRLLALLLISAAVCFAEADLDEHQDDSDDKVSNKAVPGGSSDKDALSPQERAILRRVIHTRRVIYPGYAGLGSYGGLGSGGLVSGGLVSGGRGSGGLVSGGQGSGGLVSSGRGSGGLVSGGQGSGGLGYSGSGGQGQGYGGLGQGQGYGGQGQGYGGQGQGYGGLGSSGLGSSGLGSSGQGSDGLFDENKLVAEIADQNWAKIRSSAYDRFDKLGLDDPLTTAQDSTTNIVLRIPRRVVLRLIRRYGQQAIHNVEVSARRSNAHRRRTNRRRLPVMLMRLPVRWSADEQQ